MERKSRALHDPRVLVEERREDRCVRPPVQGQGEHLGVAQLVERQPRDIRYGQLEHHQSRTLSQPSVRHGAVEVPQSWRKPPDLLEVPFARAIFHPCPGIFEQDINYL